MQVIAKGFEKELQIERLVIIGWTGKKAGLVAKGSDGKSLDVQWGPLYLRQGLPETALHLRKPELPVAEEWSVSVR